MTSTCFMLISIYARALKCFWDKCIWKFTWLWLWKELFAKEEYFAIMLRKSVFLEKGNNGNWSLMKFLLIMILNDCLRYENAKIWFWMRVNGCTCDPRKINMWLIIEAMKYD